MSADWLSTREAARYLSLAEQTLRNWRHLGRGPKYRKLGNKIRYRRADLDEYSERHIIVPSEAA